ncbi:hypothetical protein [Algoriphagus sp. A40]|uniref:hypothetical protein n=1 Tax=Algoriphagus sp. A40 TaxID=1945863 RepID=UPI00143A073A|nr:hypothetical protein [Algoriphagus sp. A40]
MPHSVAVLLLLFFVLSSCGKLVKVSPNHPSDTDNLRIRVNATKGNQGLLDYTGDVYVHLGVITSKSEHELDWRYVKFTWGSRDSAALATPVGKNNWEYSIPNIREFFGVPRDEKIYQLAVLFRSGACIDVYCKVLRNLDDSDILIPIDSQPSTD